MKIAYFKCLCGNNKAKARTLQDQGYEIRTTNSKAEWRDLALAYKEKLPFMVTNGKVERI